jgi:pimeloyl-ACP methyl ester carboxylesterase
MPLTADIYYHLFEGSAEGQRPPVVLLHGAAGNHLSWPAEVRRIPGYRIYAMDLPGHGKSGGRGMQTIAAYARAIVDWLEAVNLHSAVFVGHSMGSAIALTLALDFSEHVLGIGLIGSGPRLGVAPELLEHASSATTYNNAIQTIVQWSFSPLFPPNLLELVAKRMNETRPSVLYGDLLACDAFDEMARVCKIARPALILCGSEDRMTPLRHSQYLVNQIPGATLKVFPTAGHMLQLEQPQWVANALGNFLSSIYY